MNCAHCGAALDEAVGRCLDCGAPASPSEEAVPTCRMAPLVLPLPASAPAAIPEPPETVRCRPRDPDTEPSATCVPQPPDADTPPVGRALGEMAAHVVPVPAAAAIPAASAKAPTPSAAEAPPTSETDEYDGPTRISVAALPGPEGGLALPVFDGKYEAQRELGRGGMGVVFYGEDLSLGRPVAIKLLATRFSEDPVQAERFHREARILATLDHPGIVPIYAYGQESGQRYFVMKYVRGVPLHAPDCPLRGSRLERVQALGPVFEALQYAHDRDVLHRDLKPANILVDADRRPFLLDFGIALDSAMARVTQQNTMVGTPGYMSAEQARDPRQLTPASDQYSMGVIIYEMFCGSLPFDATSALTLAVQQLVSAPRPLRERNPDVPPAVAAVVDRALAVQPEDRFPSVMGFYRALLQSLQPAPVTPKVVRRPAPATPAVRVVRKPPASEAQAALPQSAAPHAAEPHAAPTERMEPIQPLVVRQRRSASPVPGRPDRTAPGPAAPAAVRRRRPRAPERGRGLIWLLLLPLIAVLLVIALLLVLRFTDAGPGLRRLLGAAGGSTRPVAATLAPGPSPAPPPRAASATRSQR